MKASELRIGNWVSNSKPVIVDANTIYDIAFLKADFEPIPLDELWLEKFGFKSIGLHGQVFEHCRGIGWEGDDRFVIETDCKLFYPKFNFDDCCWDEFKYVHQLQNLYFALTGEELTNNQ